MQNSSVQTHRAQSESSRPRSTALSENGVVSCQTYRRFWARVGRSISVLSVSPEI